MTTEKKQPLKWVYCKSWAVVSNVSSVSAILYFSSGWTEFCSEINQSSTFISTFIISWPGQTEY